MSYKPQTSEKTTADKAAAVTAKTAATAANQVVVHPKNSNLNSKGFSDVIRCQILSNAILSKKYIEHEIN